MLGAYFYGYAAGMPLAGWLSTKFGPRLTTGVSMALGTVLTFLYPLVLSIDGAGYYVGFAARIALGLAHSPNFPSVQVSGLYLKMYKFMSLTPVRWESI